jgi:hypothetical protein
MCVRTNENPEVSVLCGFRRPGANARGETRKNSRKWRLATFSTVSAMPAQFFAIQAIDLSIRPMYNILRIIERYAHGKRKAF